MNNKTELNNLIKKYNINNNSFFIIDNKKDFKRYNYLIGLKINNKLK